MTAQAWRRRIAIVATAVAAAGGLVGCGKDEFADRSAVVKLGGSTVTYDVEACGLDRQTVFVLAEAPDGALLQGVMGLEEDDKTGIPESTGVTVDLDPATEDSRVAAFGPEAWERRGSTGPPPGSIASARLRGSRIQFSGTVVSVDADDQPVGAAGGEQGFSVDARCDQVED
jgi:hypothetical protein